MITVFMAERKIVAMFPDCDVCRDMGHIDTPILSWRGRYYTGHGPCDCLTCLWWPDAMKRRADEQQAFIPAEALESAKRGRAFFMSEHRACPFCENGRRFSDWLQRKPEWMRSDKKTLKAFTPTGWGEEDEHSEEGQKYARRWEAENGQESDRAKSIAQKGMARFTSSLSSPALEGGPCREEPSPYHPQSVEAFTEERNRQRRALAVALKLPLSEEETEVDPWSE